MLEEGAALVSLENWKSFFAPEAEAESLLDSLADQDGVRIFFADKKKRDFFSLGVPGFSSGCSSSSEMPRFFFFCVEIVCHSAHALYPF